VKKVNWADRAIGDVYFTAVPSLEHSAIWLAERLDHPDAPTTFPVTHAGIVGPYTGYVTESWRSKHSNIDSVASVVSDAKYDERYVECWRLDDLSAENATNTFNLYLAKYVPERYGLLNLIGFAYRAVIKEITGKDVDNPIECSQVCSQGVGDYIRLSGVEPWFSVVDIRNLDPLMLRILFLAHS
jgi:hypothetical protein